MYTTDPIADMLTRIRNASMVRKARLLVPHSKLKLAIARILQQEGYIANVEKQDENGRPMISIDLKYAHGGPVIRGIRRISKPGRRVYNSYDQLPVWTPELGISILSTSSGIMSHREAKKRKVGGEVLCEIY